MPGISKLYFNAWIPKVSLALIFITMLFPAGLAAAAGIVIKSPDNLVATAINAGEVKLVWEEDSGTETGFKIERALDRQFTKETIGFNTGNSTTEFRDKSVQPLITYYYRIKAVYPEGDSTWSNTTIVLVPDSVPKAPGVFHVSSPRAMQVDTSWADNSFNESGFRIERATDSAFTNNLKTFTTKADVFRCSDTAVPGGTYYYRVVAFNTSGDSAPSNTVSATVSTNNYDDVVIWGPETTPVMINGLTIPTGISFIINGSGVVQGDKNIKLTLEDFYGTIEIPKGATMLSPDSRRPFTHLIYSPSVLNPQPPQGMQVLKSFGFGVNPSSFSPSITMSLKYNVFNQEVDASKLKVGLWDGNNWQILNSTINTQSGDITFQTSRLATFTLLIPEPSPAPPLFSVSDLLIVSNYIASGEKTIIQVTAKNSGTTPGNYQLILKLNKNIYETRWIALEPKSSSVETFIVTGLNAGYYDVDLNGINKDKYLVVQSSPTPTIMSTTSSTKTTTIVTATTSASTSEAEPIIPPHIPSKLPVGWIIGIVAAMVFVIIASIVFFLFRK